MFLKSSKQQKQLATKRWTELKAHAIQNILAQTPHRFNIVPAGRRSGKTERGKRYGVRYAIRNPGSRIGFGAPTFQQAKNIFWKDIKAMVPPWLVKTVSESELTIRTIWGSELVVFGMDKPQRIEGQPWDGIILDEYANMKAEAWPENVRPALSDRRGWAWLTGVPEGRNHYYETASRNAMIDELLVPGALKGSKYFRSPDGEWGYFSWYSADILPPDEVASARRDLDDLTFQQEYEASFVNFEGRAYYPFDRALHCARLADEYNPRAPLVFCFDFNVEPGTATIIQEIAFPRRIELPGPSIEVLGKSLFKQAKRPAEAGSGILGEVYIERNSNTPAVCRKLINDWGGHQGKIKLYGDATGGARGTAQTEGSDWDLIKREMYNHFGRDRVQCKVKASNPPERARVNAVNTRLMSGDGLVRMMVDPEKAPHVVKDFEGVRLLKGGSGEIDKKYDDKLTHLSDGVGYYVEQEYPVQGKFIASVRELNI